VSAVVKAAFICTQGTLTFHPDEPGLYPAANLLLNSRLGFVPAASQPRGNAQKKLLAQIQLPLVK
jgi:hypothetical protein